MLRNRAITAQSHGVTKAEYLGVTMTVEGITQHHYLNRISKAKRRLNQLRSIGLNNTGLRPSTNCRSYSTLVRTITEYPVHLTPWTKMLAIAYKSLENDFFNAIGGFKWRKAQWWRKAFKLQPVTYRRARLRDNLRSWLVSEERLVRAYAGTIPRRLPIDRNGMESGR